MSKIYTIEGVDGVGKSTVLKHLESLLATYYVLFTKEPTYSRDMIYIEDPFEKLFSFMVDHQKHIRSITSSLISSDAIIIDRYIHSRIAYQTYEICEKYNRIDEDFVIDYIKRMHSFSLKPDRVFLITASENVIRSRLKNRKYEEPQNIQKIVKVQDIYLKLSKDENFYVINSDNKSSFDVAHEISEQMSW